MWQTAVIILVVAAVLVYVIRHYARIYRSEVPSCSGCSGCCDGRPAALDKDRSVDGGGRSTAHECGIEGDRLHPFRMNR